MSVKLTVNGREHELEISPDVPLLYALRNDLRLAGPKFGCGLGQCGSCTVLIDGRAVRSCVRTVESAEGSKITTLEGLGTREQPHPLQKAFLEEQAMQCGYCVNGVILVAAAFLRANPRPTEEEVRKRLDPVLCRCGAHHRMVKAVMLAAEELRRNPRTARSQGRSLERGEPAKADADLIEGGEPR